MPDPFRSLPRDAAWSARYSGRCPQNPTRLFTRPARLPEFTAEHHGSVVAMGHRTFLSKGHEGFDLVRVGVAVSHCERSLTENGPQVANAEISAQLPLVYGDLHQQLLFPLIVMVFSLCFLLPMFGCPGALVRQGDATTRVIRTGACGKPDALAEEADTGRFLARRGPTSPPLLRELIVVRVFRVTPLQANQALPRTRRTEASS